MPPLPLGAACPGIGSVGVDGGKSCQHEWIVIVIKLIGEEIGAGKSIIFRAVMSVMLVRGKRVSSKAVVLRHVRRQAI